MHPTVTSKDQDLNRIEDPFFREAIRRHVDLYRAHFGDRLAAIYVSGSVHRNEAVPGVSDLDLYPFIHDPFTDEDESWFQRTSDAVVISGVPVRYGIVRPRQVGVGFLDLDLMQSETPDPLTLVKGEDGPPQFLPGPEEHIRWLARCYGLLLRHDATLVWGRDLLEGREIPPPDRRWARVWFLSPWQSMRFAVGRAAEDTAGYELPEEFPLRLRYLAKLAVYGGVALLAAHDRYVSFQGRQVLPALEGLYPQWCDFLAKTGRLYIGPIESTPEYVADYATRCAAWMDWIAHDAFGY